MRRAIPPSAGDAFRIGRPWSIARGLFCAGLCLVLFAPVARAQSEAQIKAAFLFNFARYVEWPETAFAGPADVVRICMLGDPQFGSVVSDTVSGKRVGDRRVEVELRDTLENVSNCHILFVGRAASTPAAAVRKHLDAASVFTVSDRDGFASAGGMANFIRIDNKVRFEINPSTAKESGLKVSSRLLRLAKVVE